MQILLLLSALIASLTGLVVGERPVEQTRVERSVAQQRGAVQGSVAHAKAQRAMPAPAPARTDCREASVQAKPAKRVTSTRTLLRLKQAWLE